jgi:hypothetical protein
MTVRSKCLDLFAFAFTMALLSFAVVAQTVPVPDPPEVRGQDHGVALTLRAVSDANGQDAFSFDGQLVPPVPAG